MKYGLHYIYWQKDLQCKSYVPYVEKVKNLGFDVLELGDYLVLNMPESQVEALAAASKECGVELSVGLDPPADSSLTGEDKDCREKGIEFYKRAFTRLEKLGIRTMGGNLLNAPARVPLKKYIEKEWEYGVDSLVKIGRSAAEYGIDLNIEICNRFENHILNTAEQGVRFAKAVGLPNVKILLDTFHMNIEEDSFFEAFLTAGEYLGHVHLGENHRRLPGKGHLPWNEIRDAIKAVNFQGIMTMEPLVNAGDELGDCCRIWRDMTDGADAARMDADAGQALQFMHYLFS